MKYSVVRFALAFFAYTLLVVPITFVSAGMYEDLETEGPEVVNDRVVENARCYAKPCDGYIVDTFECDENGGTCEFCEGTESAAHCRSEEHGSCELISDVHSNVCGDKYEGICVFNPQTGKSSCRKGSGASIGPCRLKTCYE